MILSWPIWFQKWASTIKSVVQSCQAVNLNKSSKSNKLMLLINGPTKLNGFSLGSETSHRFGHWACIFAFLYISFSNIMCRIWFRWFHFHVQPMFNIKCWMWISLSLKDASFPLRCLPMFTWRKLLLGSKQLTSLASPHPPQKRKIWKLQIRLRRWELVN